MPLFPLPNVVLLPETRLPLHIFEPRYRAMVETAWNGDRMIGMVLLRGFGGDDSLPPISEMGSAGEIVDLVPLDDGRYDIVLEGRFRFRVEAEEPHEPYRVARVAMSPVVPLEPSGIVRDTLRERLTAEFARLARDLGRPEAGLLPSEASDEGLVNEALVRLDLGADELYRLLVAPTLAERYAWTLSHLGDLAERLELLAPFRARAGGAQWN